jgi:hypothetical protein
MNKQQLTTVAQLRAFLNGTQEVQFEPQGEDSQRYVVSLSTPWRLTVPDGGHLLLCKRD